jgi:hypothetical protein
MAFQYIDTSTIFDAFNDSKKYMRPLFEPIQEFERIARNQPYPGIPSEYPKVTDGTTAAVIQKTPRRIIQQLPTGKVESDDDLQSIIANYIYTHEILPNANSQFSLLQKCWTTVGKGLTAGAQPGFVPFLNRGEYFGTDITLPYIKDVFLEPGKVSDIDSNFIFMRAWYQPRDIKAIIARENKLTSNAKDRKEEYQSGWNLAALAEIQDSISQKDDLSTTPTEKDKNNRTGGIEIIHCFQRGIKGTFLSIHVPTKTVVRTKTNKDPRGELPLHYFYADTDGSNPLGRGYVELVGAMQNLMDSEVQMYQFNRALMLNPPMIKRGDWNDAMAKLLPNVIIDIGDGPNNSFEPVKLDSGALNNFSNNYSLMQSQLYMLLSAPNANISAESGSQTFSKTQAGVQQQTANLNIDDNFIRKQFETWFGRVSETMINLYFAERTGTKTFSVDNETANKLRKLDSGLVGPNNQVKIDFSTETTKLKFTVDASTSNLKDNQDQVEKATNLLELAMKYPQLDSKNGGPIDTTELSDRIVINSGIEDPEKVVIKQKDENGQPVQQQQPQLGPQDVAQIATQVTQQALQQQKANDTAEHPIIKLMTSLNIKFPDLPEDSKQEVLKIIGIPTQQQSPTQQNIALKANQQAHSLLDSMAPQPDPAANSQQSGEQGQAASTSSPTSNSGATAPIVDDPAFRQELMKMGLSADQAGQGLALLHAGHAPEDVIRMLGVTA